MSAKHFVSFKQCGGFMFALVVTYLYSQCAVSRFIFFMCVMYQYWNIYKPSKWYHYSCYAPFLDPVIFEHLEDTVLEDDDDPVKMSVEFQTRSASKGQVLIVWEHDNELFKAGKSKKTHGVTSCQLSYSDDVEGEWKVHIVDLKLGRSTTSSCEVTLEEYDSDWTLG